MKDVRRAQVGILVGQLAVCDLMLVKFLDCQRKKIRERESNASFLGGWRPEADLKLFRRPQAGLGLGHFKQLGRLAVLSTAITECASSP
jgi:hypothetical protein